MSRVVLLSWVITILLMSSCSFKYNSQATAVLDEVEAHINENPDSALSVIQSIDTSKLRSPSIIARFSLLRIMAMDKVNKDITAPYLLEPALSWYSKYGSPDDKLKLFYYQGAVRQELKDYIGAAESYYMAEGFASKSTDSHAEGLLYLAIASVYNTTFNVSKQEEYVRKSLSVFLQSGDPMYMSAVGDLAMVYHSRKDWHHADSLYRLAISNSETYPEAKCIYLSNYARMKLLQDNEDAEGAIELLNQKRRLSGKGFTPKEAGAYAYASELIGDTNTADALLSRMVLNPDINRLDILPWLVRVSYARGDYESAFQYQSEAHNIESQAVEEALADGIAQSLMVVSERSAQMIKHRYSVIVLIALIIACLLLMLYSFSSLKNRKIGEDRDRLISICDSLQSEMEEYEQRITFLNSEMMDNRSLLHNRIRVMEEKIAKERETYTKERVHRLRQLGGLRSTLWWRERGGMKESLAIQKIKDDISYVFQLDNDGRILVRRLDRELDGAISRLRNELHLRGNPKEVLFLCCCILDLEPEMISEIIGITKANVYEKRSRLRARIRELGDPLLSVLVEKTNKLH